MTEKIDCLNIFQQKDYTFIDFSQSMISALSYQTFCRNSIQYTFANMFIPCCDLYAVRIGVCMYFCPIRCDLISVESFLVLLCDGPDYCITTLHILSSSSPAQPTVSRHPFLLNRLYDSEC